MMSLTSLLRKSDVRSKLSELFPRQPVPRDYAPKAPALTMNYGLVGTAFDYLLRFYLERLNPRVITRKWVAEDVRDEFKSKVDLIRERRSEYGSSFRSLIWPRSRRFNLANRILEDAQRSRSRFMRSGKIRKDLLVSALSLAQLDPFYRSGQDEYRLGTIDPRDIRDLKALISIVNPRMFKAKKIAVLNPTFGRASRLVGGADADFLIDDMLVEIKTSMQMRLKRETYNQLIGYYTLSLIHRVDQVSPANAISRLGVYFARFGKLHVYHVSEIADSQKFQSFARWLKRRAQQHNPGF